MSADETWTLSSPKEKLICPMFLNNDTEIGQEKKLIGEPAETSMYKYAIDECENINIFNDFVR